MAEVCETGNFLPLHDNILNMVRYIAKVTVNHYRKCQVVYRLQLVSMALEAWMTLKGRIAHFVS